MDLCTHCRGLHGAQDCDEAWITNTKGKNKGRGKGGGKSGDSQWRSRGDWQHRGSSRGDWYHCLYKRGVTHAPGSDEMWLCIAPRVYADIHVDLRGRWSLWDLL